MKNLLLLALISIPMLSISQKRDTTLYKAGVELIKYEKQYSSGVMLQLAGVGLAVAGSVGDAKTGTRGPLIAAGGAMAFIGFIMQIASSGHIKKAGMYLIRNKIVIPL